MSEPNPDNILRIECPECSKVMRVSKSMQGKTGKCPGCGNRIRIPGANTPSASKAKRPSTSRPTRSTGLSSAQLTNESTIATRTESETQRSGSRELSKGIQVLESRTVPVVWLLRICMLILAINGLIFWRLYEAGRRTDSLVTAQEITSVVQLVFICVTAVMYLRWKYQACANLHRSCTSRLRFSASGCCLYYFFPVFNLVYPMRAMLEIQSRSKANVGHMVYIWWVFWILSCLIAQKIFRTNNIQLEPLCIAAILCFSMAIVAGLFLVKIIKAVTEKQRRYRLTIEGVTS